MMKQRSLRCYAALEVFCEKPRSLTCSRSQYVPAFRTFPAATSRRAVTISRLSVSSNGLTPAKSCLALFDASITSSNWLGIFRRQSSCHKFPAIKSTGGAGWLSLLYRSRTA